MENESYNQLTDNVKKKNTTFTLALFGTIGVIGIIIACFSFKALFATLAIFNFLMYTNIAMTTLGNAFIGREIDLNYDIVWKMIFILSTALFSGLYLIC